MSRVAISVSIGLRCKLSLNVQADLVNAYNASVINYHMIVVCFPDHQQNGKHTLPF